MSGLPQARSLPGANAVGDVAATLSGNGARQQAPVPIADAASLHQQPQPVASSSRNPQFGPNPFFRYPTPTPEQIEEELPPYMEWENVPLGLLLDRLARNAYNDMNVLVNNTCVGCSGWGTVKSDD
jgi:hypothetical protein